MTSSKFLGEGLGSDFQNFHFSPRLPRPQKSRTLQISQNIKLIKPNNQHNQQTNLIQYYQFSTDSVHLTSYNFHRQTLRSTFQNFHSSPRHPRPQNFSNFANFTNHQTHQSTQITHSSHHIQPIPLQINSFNFHAQTTSSTQKIFNISPTHSAHKFIKNQNFTIHPNNSHTIGNIQIYHLQPIRNATNPNQLIHIFTAKHSRSNYQNFKLFDLHPPPKKFIPKNSTPKNFLQSLYQFHTI